MEIETWRNNIKKAISTIPLSGKDRADATFEYGILGKVIHLLNNIEVKEVDLEKEISDYLTLYHLHVKDGGRVVFDNNDSPNFMCDIRHIAKHFYELGIKAKGE